MERIDNKLTPTKIMRLLQLAESATPQHGSATAPGRARRRVLCDRNVMETTAEQESLMPCNSGENNGNTQCGSSGLIDLDHCEVFGESCAGDMDKFAAGISFSTSKSFNPGEMTGRSTGTSECDADARRRETAAIEELAARLQQQSCDVAQIVRDSVYGESFKQTQRDLSQDEMSFIRDRGELPVPASQLDPNLTATRAHTDRHLADTTSDLSVGSYFMKGSANLTNMIGPSDSPQHELSMAPSLLEGDSRTYGLQPGFTTINDSDCVVLDTTLDRVPIRQPRPSIPVASVPSIPPSIPFVPSVHTVPSLNTVPSMRTAIPSGNAIPSMRTAPGNTIPSVNIIPSVHEIPVSVATVPAAPVLCAPQLQHLAPHSSRNNEDSSLGLDASLSISLIAKCLGKCDAEVTPSMLITEAKLKKKSIKKPALPARDPSEGQKDTFTIPNANKSRLVPTELENPNFISTLKQSGRSHTASSTDSVNTVVNVPKNNIADLKTVGKHTLFNTNENKENECNETPVMNTPLKDCTKVDYGTGSKTKSSSTKSTRTVCTVQENRISTSNTSEGSLLQSSSVDAQWAGFSPNCEYKELERSVNWQELLLRQQTLDKVAPCRWVKVETEPVLGYVGVCTTTRVKLTSIKEAWLSVRLRLDDSCPDDSSVAVDVPRFPLLLVPGDSDSLPVTITALEPTDENITLTVLLKDTCEDTEMQQEARLHLKFILPDVKVVTATNDGMVTFPPTQYGAETVKSFVLMSDSSQLHLTLSVSENTDVFSIGSVEQIKRTDIERRLAIDHRLVTEEGMVAGSKYRAMKRNTKQVCVLTKGNAVRVMMICQAPTNSGSEISKTTANGALSLHLVGTNALIQKVAMTAVVGTIKLLFQMTGDKLYLTKDAHTLNVKNVGSIGGSWRTMVRGIHAEHFTVTPALLEVAAGGIGALDIAHRRQQQPIEGLLVLESVHEGKDLLLDLVASQEKFSSFPIKTNQTELAWVREGRKDISLKNTSDRRVTAKCKIHGEGFFMENPRESGIELVLNFAPGECLELSVIYNPIQKGSHKAKIAICLEQDTSCVKSVRLHGCCGSGTGHVRWATGALTCGEMAIVFARRRAPVTLTLENRSREPSFYSARLLFNMQYRSLGALSRVTPARGVLAPHGSAQLSVELDWVRLERLSNAAAGTLASLFVLVGPEMNRRRILRILKKEQSGDPTASPAEDLSRLKGQFHAEDPRLDLEIQDFDETKKSLPTLTASIQELTAQIELNRDSPGERTIMVADETSIEHHTLLD